LPLKILSELKPVLEEVGDGTNRLIKATEENKEKLNEVTKQGDKILTQTEQKPPRCQSSASDEENNGLKTPAAKKKLFDSPSMADTTGGVPHNVTTQPEPEVSTPCDYHFDAYDETSY
jgi:hypothetical protein